MKKYFGTDGIRGIPNDTLSQDLISKISASVEQHINPKNIGVISDTRSSSDEILNWISIGFSSKVNIYNHGVLPSGSMPIILKKFNYDLGIIISASHNPAEYNGIKLIQQNGSKLDDNIEISIEKNIDSLELPNEHAEIINVSDGNPIKTTQYYLHIYDALKQPWPGFITFEEALKKYSSKRLSFLNESRLLNVDKMNMLMPGCIKFKDIKEGIRDSLF